MFIASIRRDGSYEMRYVQKRILHSLSIIPRCFRCIAVVMGRALNHQEGSDASPWLAMVHAFPENIIIAGRRFRVSYRTYVIGRFNWVLGLGLAVYLTIYNWFFAKAISHVRVSRKRGRAIALGSSTALWQLFKWVESYAVAVEFSPFA